MALDVPFNDNDPKYRCCCRCCHVRCGAFIIAILQACELLSIVSKLGKSVVNFGPNTNATAYIPLIFSICYFVVFVVCVVFLFIGLCQGIPKYLNPMLIMMLFIIGFYVIVIILLIVVLVVANEPLIDFIEEQLAMEEGTHVSFGTQERDAMQTALKIVLIGLIVALLIATLIEVWWFLVIKACRNYFEDWLACHPGTPYNASGSWTVGRQSGYAPAGQNDVNVVVMQQQPGPGGQYPPVPQQGYYPPAPGYKETMG